MRDKVNILLSQIFFYTFTLLQRFIYVSFPVCSCPKYLTFTFKPVSTETFSAKAAVASHHVGTRRIAMTTVSTFFTLVYIWHEHLKPKKLICSFFPPSVCNNINKTAKNFQKLKSGYLQDASSPIRTMVDQNLCPRGFWGSHINLVDYSWFLLAFQAV